MCEVKKKETCVVITSDRELATQAENRSNVIAILAETEDLYNAESLIKNIRIAQRMRADKIKIDYANIEK